jgi:diadenosine tetraphosphate (Ap4A) HIT family hydrolase
MAFDECFDERTERQHCETSCTGVFQSKPDQPISESATLEALVDLGVDERDQAGACAIGGEANHLAVNRQLVAITVRHVSHLDTLRRGEMTTTESAELGSILHRLVPAVKAATGVERVYFLALMEKVAHFHIWLVPKKDEGPLRGVDYLAQRPPLTASHAAAEAMSRKIRAEFEPS